MTESRVGVPTTLPGGQTSRIVEQVLDQLDGHAHALGDTKWEKSPRIINWLLVAVVDDAAGA